MLYNIKIRHNLLQIHKKAVLLHQVFHGIRFKVNKRLGQGVDPFFVSIPKESSSNEIQMIITTPSKNKEKSHSILIYIKKYVIKHKNKMQSLADSKKGCIFASSFSCY